MLLRAKELDGCKVHATDGDLGEVKDFLFDVDAWTLRYFVVETGNWLHNRRVLIAPDAVAAPGFSADPRELRVNLTQEQIKDSPDVDTQKTFSRQQETAYRDYYAWPMYWPIGSFTAGGIGVAPPLVAAHVPSSADGAIARAGRDEEESSLRGANEVRGYALHAADGDVGHVRDFALDGGDWKVRYLIIDTGNWLRGKDVLIAPPWISAVSWSNSEVDTKLNMEQVKTAPEYDDKGEITPAYESALREHYGRP